MIAAAMLFTACGSDDDVQEVEITSRGTVTDDMGNTYNWVQIGSLQWTTSNAKNGPLLVDMTYYAGWRYQNAFTDEQKEDFMENYYPIHGNPMNFKDAMESAPEGWRVPTDEDWQNLERALGMKNTNSKGWRGDNTAMLLQQKDHGTELGMTLGGVCTETPVWGWVEYNLDYVKEYAFYWTSTVDPSYTDKEAAYYRKMFFNRGSVERQCGVTDKYMSVRWVRDAK